jgi:hypothetical protein
MYIGSVAKIITIGITRDWEVAQTIHLNSQYLKKFLKKMEILITKRCLKSIVKDVNGLILMK